MLNFLLGPSSFTASAEGISSWKVGLPNVTREVFVEPGISVVFPFPNAPRASFEITDQSPSSISTQLIPSQELLNEYPFEFHLLVHYLFTDLSLTITLELENLSNTSIGWAPAIFCDFLIPWHPHLSLSHYQLDIWAKKAFYLLSDGNSCMTKDFDRLSSLSDSRLNNLCLTNLKASSLAVGPKGGEENTTIILNTFSTLSTIKTLSLPKGYQVGLFMGNPGSTLSKKGNHFISPFSKSSFSVTINLI